MVVACVRVRGGCVFRQVAYAWATSLNEDEAAALLRRLNMGEGVVEYAMEIGAFNHAFQLAQLAAKNKLPDVHLKYAMFLEDSGRFVEAEGEFVAAGGHRLDRSRFCLYACLLLQSNGGAKGWLSCGHCGQNKCKHTVCGAQLSVALNTWLIVETDLQPHILTLQQDQLMDRFAAFGALSPCVQASPVKPSICTCTTRTGQQRCALQSAVSRGLWMTSIWHR